MISVIIPIHNQADKIEACLDSLLAQSEKDWEIILVDDGSTDNLKAVVEKYKNIIPAEKFKFFSKANEGSNPTRNFGFSKSKGDYLLFCDADLIMETKMLMTMKQALEKHGEASFVFSSFKYGQKLFKLFPYDIEPVSYTHLTLPTKRIV